MAEGSSLDSPAKDPLLVSDSNLKTIPAPEEFILGDSTDRLLRLAKQFGALSTEPEQTKSAKDVDFRRSFKPFSSECASTDDSNARPVRPIFYEVTTVDETGYVHLDKKKLFRKAWKLNPNETPNVDPSEIERGLKFLKDMIANLKNEETKASSQQTEQKKSSSSEEQVKEKLTEFKYEKKNKLLDRNPQLIPMCKELSLCNEGKFSEEDLELHPAVNIFRRIAYPLLCEKHFSDKFPTGALAEEVEPLESINISMDHFEFCHKELENNFLNLFKGEKIADVAIKLEKNPEINNLFPSFENFLRESDNGSRYPLECFTIILAMLKNPYRKFEFICDHKLPVVNEQKVIAEYLVNCFTKENILCDKVVSEKLSETVITFANVHSSFLAQIVTGFEELLSNQTDGKVAYRICCLVLNIMSSIGPTIILLCLPQHFKKIACLAANDPNQELHNNLLRASEILIADSIENESLIEAEPSENHFSLRISFSSDCYKYFGSSLTNRLVPIFRKYKERKNREERYLSIKHAIFPTKEGYMNMEMEYLKDRECKRSEDSESLNRGEVKECTSDSVSKVFCSPTARLCHKIQEIFGLSDKDLEDDKKQVSIVYLM